MTTIMSGLHLLLLLILLPSRTGSVSSICRSKSFVACHPRHIQVLTQFKNEFDTRGCNHNDFSNGVWCDNSTGAVTKLNLTACLSGPLKSNSSLFQFHELRCLVLSHNNFISSSVPSEFGNLNKLEALRLSFNGFLGQIPSSFSNLSLLSSLDMSYNHLSGPLNPNSSLFGLHHLTYLNLGFNNFSSSIPSEIGNLNKLRGLSLYSNGFLGQVPPTFSNLTWLTQLLLVQNKLTGSFPLVQNLTKLSALDLSHNQFTGTIPSSLLTMPFLTYIVLTDNHLTGSIEVPNSSSSSRLERLLLGNNHFEGKIIEPISKFTTLMYLDLSFLNTSYPIDLSLFSSLKSLVALDISGNNISPASLRAASGIPLSMVGLILLRCGIREFPNILRTLQKLELMDLSYNLIKGKIPEWLWSLPRLSTVNLISNSINGFGGSAEALANSTTMLILDLDTNNFEGPLPDLPLSISVFSANYNSFTGEIPLSICNRISLAALDLSYNNLTGQIPQCLSKLMFLNLRKNNLEGSIPNIFDIDSSLKSLDVGYNRLTGRLPRSLLNCSSLRFLSVDNNRIKDTFPFWLKALPNLRVLILSSNKFYGPISLPHQGSLGFPELRIFEISGNKFTGSLPPNYFENWKASSLTMNQDGALYMIYTTNASIYYTYQESIDLRYKGLYMEQANVLTSYSAIDFSGNLLKGHIPESIGLLKALIALNLSNNAFTGHIPLSFANLKELESLDLSGNQLSGTIPNGLGSLSFLEYINVSHNQLKGEIPQGTQIIGQSKSSFEGNVGLCGLPLEKSCFDTSSPPMQHHKQEDKEEEEKEEALNRKAVAIGCGPGVLFGLAVAQVIASYKPQWLAKITGTNKCRNC